MTLKKKKKLKLIQQFRALKLPCKEKKPVENIHTSIWSQLKITWKCTDKETFRLVEDKLVHIEL